MQEPLARSEIAPFSQSQHPEHHLTTTQTSSPLTSSPCLACSSQGSSSHPPSLFLCLLLLLLGSPAARPTSSYPASPFLVPFVAAPSPAVRQHVVRHRTSTSPPPAVPRIPRLLWPRPWALLRIDWLTCHAVIEDAPPEEERQEGNPVLLDGLRCLGNWYVSPQSESLPHQAHRIEQAEPPSSTPSAARVFCSTRMPTTPPMPMSRTVSRSSPSLLVRSNSVRPHRCHNTDCTSELELDEEGTRISLTIVDTPGFGDQIDNEAR